MYRVSDLKRLNQLSPKLFVIEKNVSSRSYFVSRVIFYDGHIFPRFQDDLCFLKWNYMSLFMCETL